jgi:hypothetical protein
MSINQSIENFLNTANLPDNLRNWAHGFQSVVTIVTAEKVTKTELREIYNGANRNPDSGRLLNSDLSNIDKSIIQSIIDNTTDNNLKSKMITLLGDFENWLNS